MAMEVGFKEEPLNLQEEDDFLDENSTILMSRSFEKNELAALIPTFIRGGKYTAA